MKIGFLGLGKLGLPVALAIEARGHEVIGWDSSPVVRSNIEAKTLPYKEVDAQELLTNSKMKLDNDFNGCDIVFMAIQTPHEPRFEGTIRVPSERADFDYTYLKQAVIEIVKKQTTSTVLVLISTVLPGTIEREIEPLLSDKVSFVYNPFFIAMGTVVHDFRNPEFVLLGIEDKEAPEKVISFYTDFYSDEVPIQQMPIRDAELTKVAYNTFIGMKIVFANTLMEICHLNGGNVDNVTDCLKMARKRLISTSYLNAGMGDGGGCHPRDNIAMSHIANKLGLSHNFFDDLMLAREHQTEFLANLVIKEATERNLPITILGKSFKPETNIQTGSPAILLANILKEKGVEFKHLGEGESLTEPEKGLYFLATRHEGNAEIAQRLSFGSVVIDPFGYAVQYRNGVEIIHIGRK